jgi:Acyltransferase family
MKRNIALDILKLIMSFMVIGIHAHFLSDLSPTGSFLAGNGLFRLAVPVFLLINGFFFSSVLNKNKSRVWFKRVIQLYLFWMLCYSWYWFEGSLESIPAFVTTLFFGYYHLWYIPGMIGAALILIPLKDMKTPALLSIIIIMSLAGILIQYLGSYGIVPRPPENHFWNYEWFHRNFAFFGFPYFALGYLIKRTDLVNRISRNKALLSTVLGLALLMGESFFNYLQPGRSGGFDNYISVLILCPAIFLFFLKLEIPSETRIVASISSAVYFIHIFFIKSLPVIFDMGATMLTLLTIVFSVAASFIVIFINKKFLKFIL